MELTKENIEALLSAKMESVIGDRYQDQLETVVFQEKNSDSSDDALDGDISKANKEKGHKRGASVTDTESNLEELSKATLGSYVKKASRDYAKHVTGTATTNTDSKKWDDHADKAWKRQQGLNKAVDKLTKEEFEDAYESAPDQQAEVFLDESTGEQFYYELNEETLEERKIVIRITSKGERIKRITCGKGKIAKSVNGRIVCVTPTGRERLTKKLATKRSVRTKKAKGAGFKKRVNFKRQRAMKKRRQMGIRSQ